MRKNTMHDFWAKVSVCMGGCWDWIGPRSRRGYGVFFQDGGKLLPHRVTYEIEHGPIPVGLVIDHLCRNPPCVNPLHLEAVTNSENVIRGIGPSTYWRERDECGRGHEFDGFSGGQRTCSQCTALRYAKYIAKNPEHHRRRHARNEANRRARLRARENANVAR